MEYILEMEEEIEKKWGIQILWTVMWHDELIKHVKVQMKQKYFIHITFFIKLEIFFSYIYREKIIKWEIKNMERAEE